MILADAALGSGNPFGSTLLWFCACLVCLMLVSGAALAVVLHRQSRRKPPGGVS